MSRKWTWVLPIAVFAASAWFNAGYGAIKTHYKCGSGSCLTLSEQCLQSGGTCQWCNSNDNKELCQQVWAETCDTTGDAQCSGTTYTGTCVQGFCAGSMNPSSGCTLPKCQLSQPG
jgi:hypothetical protein